MSPPDEAPALEEAKAFLRCEFWMPVHDLEPVHVRALVDYVANLVPADLKLPIDVPK